MLEMMFIIAIIIEIGFPIALAFFLIRKMKSSWVVVAVGAMAFVVSQFIHFPILQGLQPAWTSEQFLAMPEMVQNLIYAITLGFLAGICEEPMRWLSFQLLHEKGDNVQTGVLLGVGHGGVESIVLVGLTVLSNFVVMVGLQNGWISEIPGVTPDMVTGFFSIPWHLPLAGAVERLSAVGLHIGLSVMVWQSVKRRNLLWFLAAILVHALFDAASVMLVIMGVGTWAIEAVVFSVALVIVLWTIKTIKREWAIQMENEPTPAEIAAV
jgi:uncharacterized membrane protein YhfC